MLGSNTADRHRLIDEASRMVVDRLVSSRLSAISDTPDFTGLGDPYLNRVIAGYLEGTTPGDLIAILHEIEKTLGRDRSNPAVVAIDIDLVTSTSSDGTVTIHSPREYRTSIFRQLRENMNISSR